ncbi:hypothetical protein ACFT0G_06010 [Streptomyces sp. NPDC057020]
MQNATPLPPLSDDVIRRLERSAEAGRGAEEAMRRQHETTQQNGQATQ